GHRGDASYAGARCGATAGHRPARARRGKDRVTPEIAGLATETFRSMTRSGGMARTSAWCSRHGWLVGLVWGLAESTVFFIVPDVAVAFIAAMSPRDWWKAAVASIVGTLIGAVILLLAI